MAIEEDPPAGVPDWVLTFGDMMSLLLTFFIMLVSMSEMKSQDKFQAMADSMRKQFGFDMSSMSFIPGWAKPRSTKISSLATAGRTRKNNTMEGGQKAHGATGENPSVKIVRPGNRTAVGTSIYFLADSSELSEQMRQDLQAIALDIVGKPHKIEIRGHTSAKPVDPSSGYSDRWQLAYERCRKTMQYLVDDLKIDSQRARMSLAGPNEPVHIGVDPVKLQQNDRVEIFLLDEVVQDLAGTPAEQAQRFSDGKE